MPLSIEWARLRDMIKYKIDKHVHHYLSWSDATLELHTSKTPEQMPRSSPMSLPLSSPSTFTPSPASLAHQGLVIPPFPKRARRKDTSLRVFNSGMDEKEAQGYQKQLFEQLDDFENHPPFTIQRLCELCLGPKKYYKTIGKYLRALERTILVTSTKDMYSSEFGAGDVETVAAYGDNESLRMAMTPVFSPIPFLHDDARRSRSPSPFELAATRRPGGIEALASDPLVSPQGLGLVDELDDPKPGHLADRPTALTTVASTERTSIPPTLSERFVKSSSPESEEGTRETADSRQAEDAEVEGMVLDDNVTEDEDKENRPSQ
ncbi:PPP4R2-domain-containing protein [Ramaria rubella]|nr:PPP4R2-domain-containing protein [Ramaria rubella]